MAALFQTLTLDSWSVMVWNLGRVGGMNTAGMTATWLFFVGFVMLGSFGLLNLLTGVFIESLLEITKEHEKKGENDKVEQRLHLISLIAAAFVETDDDQGGTLDQNELPHLLELCKDYQEALSFVGLPYDKFERACMVADYDHTGRSYWEKEDPYTGEKHVSVHHSTYRPEVPKGYSPSEERPEGVMEGELVQALTLMDEPTIKGDHFAVMKRLRMVEMQNSRMEVQSCPLACIVGSPSSCNEMLMRQMACCCAGAPVRDPQLHA